MVNGGESDPPSLRARFLRATDRYELRRMLGSGGFGDVYEAFDRERGTIAALKLLREDTPDARYRLKREFRALADIVHPNLVQLYELYTDDTVCFITMELVEGVSFLEYVTGPSPSPSAWTSESEAHLRDALRQLVEGLHHLHGAGRLHLDIKPSNVRVSSQGRVAIVDFGLVDELDGAAPTREVSGTPAYMSPEQMQGRALTPASDLYSVGVVLYQALANATPWTESSQRLFAQKLTVPPSPALRRPDVQLPADLVALSLELLSPDPAARPTSADLLARLSTDASGISQVGDAPFVGRGPEMTELRLALGSALAGQAAAVLVGGPSGIGKSSLVVKFLQDVAKRGRGIVVLRGRCYEQESTPFKTVDGLIDGLGRYLSTLPDGEMLELVQDGVDELSQLFPALRRVPGLPPPLSVSTPQDMVATRRAAIGELRAILTRLAERGPVVLFVDDLQWGDMEGASLLGDVLRGANAPPVLLVATHRDGDDARAPPVLTLLARLRSAQGTYVSSLDVGPLSDDDCAKLAESFAGVGSSSAQAIAKEARGQPYLVTELAALGSRSPGGQDVGLEHALRQRIRDLDPTSRTVVEMVAAFGRRLPTETLRAAAGFEGDMTRTLRALQAARLVRISGSGSGETVEPYHDRVRVVVDKLGVSSTGQLIHTRLAKTLESLGGADPEELAYHWAQAGNLGVASRYLVEAARQAMASLAFQHAATLLARVIAWDLIPAADRQRVRIMRAEALADGGDATSAADAYLLAAEDAPLAVRLELVSKAAAQLVSAGDPKRGEEVFRHVLEVLGTPVPTDPKELRAKLAELTRTTASLVMGSGSRSESSLTPLDRVRVDATYEASRYFGAVNPLFAGCLARLSYQHAFECDEPGRLARAIAHDATLIASVGGEQAREREEIVLALAESFLEGRPLPAVSAAVTVARATCAMLHHRWRDAIDHLAWAEEQLRARGRATWSLSFVIGYAPFALLQIGEWRRASLMAASGIEEARQRGDLFLEAQLRAGAGWCGKLLEDRPDLAREALLDALARWTTAAPDALSFGVGLSLSLVRLYETSGCSTQPLAALRELGERFQPTGFLKMESFRASYRLAMGRALVAAALATPEGPARAALVLEARGVAAALRQEWNPALIGHTLLIEAGIASLAHDGDNEPVAMALSAAVDVLDRQGLSDAAAAARLRLGRFLSGVQGSELADEGRLFFHRQGFERDDRIAAALVPGRY